MTPEIEFKPSQGKLYGFFKYTWRYFFYTHLFKQCDPLTQCFWPNLGPGPFMIYWVFRFKFLWVISDIKFDGFPVFRSRENALCLQPAAIELGSNIHKAYLLTFGNSFMSLRPKLNQLPIPDPPDDLQHKWRHCCSTFHFSTHVPLALTGKVRTLNICVSPPNNLPGPNQLTSSCAGPSILSTFRSASTQLLQSASQVYSNAFRGRYQTLCRVLYQHFVSHTRKSWEIRESRLVQPHLALPWILFGMI